MVPYAGPFVAGTFISLIALVTRGTWHGVAAAIYFITYGQIEGNILGPLIFRRTVHVNPLVVTLSMLFFGEIAGDHGRGRRRAGRRRAADHPARGPAHPARAAPPARGERRAE